MPNSLFLCPRRTFRQADSASELIETDRRLIEEGQCSRLSPHEASGRTKDNASFRALFYWGHLDLGRRKRPALRSTTQTPKAREHNPG